MNDVEPQWELHTQIPWELRDKVRAAAKADDRSVTSWVRLALREKLNRGAVVEDGGGE